MSQSKALAAMFLVVGMPDRLGMETLLGGHWQSGLWDL